MNLAGGGVRPKAGCFMLASSEIIDCDAVMVVIAHPDDETVALGGQLSRMRGIRLLHVTDGAPANMHDAWANGCEKREDYAFQRRRELIQAVAKAGIDASSLLTFNVPDQSAPFQMPLLADRLAELLRECGITIVLAHAFEGGHPDHDATAFVVHAARHLLLRDTPVLIELLEFPLYHSREGRMQPHEFPVGCTDRPEVTIHLDAAALSRKQEMLDAFVTQRGTLLLFDSDLERLRAAPEYDFDALPNGGELLYERFDWGLSGETWLSLIQYARQRLELPRWL